MLGIKKRLGQLEEITGTRSAEENSADSLPRIQKRIPLQPEDLYVRRLYSSTSDVDMDKPFSPVEITSKMKRVNDEMSTRSQAEEISS